MVVYEAVGVLYPGIKEEDFFCREGGGQNVAISADSELEPGEIIILPDLGDGWVDAGVAVIDRQSAIRVLAHVNSVSEDEIELHELGVAISI